MFTSDDTQNTTNTPLNKNCYQEKVGDIFDGEIYYYQ